MAAAAVSPLLPGWNTSCQLCRMLSRLFVTPSTVHKLLVPGRTKDSWLSSKVLQANSTLVIGLSARVRLHAAGDVQGDLPRQPLFQGGRRPGECCFSLNAASGIQERQQQLSWAFSVNLSCACDGVWGGSWLIAPCLLVLACTATTGHFSVNESTL